MTVLLMLVTFILLLTVDYFYSKRHALEASVKTEAQPETAAAAPRLRATVVAGFEVPDNVRFHPGHTWALTESPNLVRVGLDSFAARLAGRVDELVLPLRGQWIRQGQRIWTIRRDGQKAEM